MATALPRERRARGLPARPQWALCFAALLAAVPLWTGACAKVAVERSLRVQPLEKARESSEERGVGARVEGKRDGGVVQVQVHSVRRCQSVILQRAEGLERTTRAAVGHTLKMQWAMGGLFFASGAGIAAWQWSHPAPPAADGLVAPDRSRSTWLQAGAIGAIGVGLLVGSLWQQLGLGTAERSLGVRELRREGRVRDCGPAPPGAARVRLTLPDGTSLHADVDASGRATLPLPDNVESALQESDRRATLEVLGDWRSQTRIGL